MVRDDELRARRTRQGSDQKRGSKETLTGRREILLGTAAAATSALFLGGGAISLADDDGVSEKSRQFELAYREVVGGAAPEEAQVTLDLPDLAENGNTVPYKLDVASPMTAADYIVKLHLLSTANPQARVATFHFTPQSGKAAVTGRMRLAKTQDVVAIAETSSGKFLMARRNVKVTIGGCGNE
jgi:sulfur-oxidizing protein SoxY